MAEDVFKDIPEEFIEVAKVKYEEYLDKPSDVPKLTFEEFSSKLYEYKLITEELKELEEELEELYSKKESTENRLEELESKLFEMKVAKLLEDFNSTYEIIVNEEDLTQEEKLDKLKAYYYTVVRDMAKEVRFLANLQDLINKQDSEGYNDVLLINFNEFVKQHYD